MILRMPYPTRFLRLAVAAALLAASAWPAAAEGGEYGGPPRCGPSPRCLPHAPPGFGPGPSYGGPPIVSGYLPRNNNLPMYNEPPPRFPGE